MNRHEHVTDLVTDYVLGLLPEQQTDYLRNHIVECSQCRQELSNERKMSADIRSTFASISVPDQRQLDMLMPMAPQIQTGWSQSKQLKNGLVIAIATVIISLTTIGLRAGFSQNSWLYPPPTAYSTATLVTDTPTHTLIATPSSDVLYGLTANTPEPIQARLSPHPVVIPVPAATFLN